MTIIMRQRELPIRVPLKLLCAANKFMFLAGYDKVSVNFLSPSIILENILFYTKCSVFFTSR